MMKVLVVDDSVVFRTQITNSLSGVKGVEVVGSAPNGKIAMQRLEQMSVDLVTLDMEMPELDGLSTLKLIREKKFPVKVIVFSAQTTSGAEKALLALEAGADDIVAKPSGDSFSIESSQLAISDLLVPKVIQFVDPMLKQISAPSFNSSYELNQDKLNRKFSGSEPSVIVIASSTGGPTALESLFKNLPRSIKPPILIAQHMPPVFTDILAKRIVSLTGLNVAEAKDGEIVKPGMIRICPGNYHMKLRKQSNDVQVKLSQEPLRNSVRPAADYLFESAAESFREKCLGVVLTGMGEDGRVGSQAVKLMGGKVLIQDKESCTVFGMPGAVFEAGSFDEMLSLEKLSNILNQWRME